MCLMIVSQYETDGLRFATDENDAVNRFLQWKEKQYSTCSVQYYVQYRA